VTAHRLLPPHWNRSASLESSGTGFAGMADDAEAAAGAAAFHRCLRRKLSRAVMPRPHKCSKLPQRRTWHRALIFSRLWPAKELPDHLLSRGATADPILPRPQSCLV
jgi:hypothetical protein